MKQRIVNILVTDFGYFPTGRKSPEGAKPKGMSAETVLGEINGRIAQLDEVIQKCEGKFGKHTFVGDHPVLGPITMQQWRKFHWAHGRHHIRQILRSDETSADLELTFALIFAVVNIAQT